MKLLSLKTVNATQSILTVSFNGAVFTVSNFKGVLGTKMKKYFGTQVQIRPVARNRKGHFVSIKGLEAQILNLTNYTAAKPVVSVESQEEEDMLTIKEVLRTFGIDTTKIVEGNNKIKIGNTQFDYYYTYDLEDCEDFHMLSINGEDLFYADKSCKYPQRMEEDAKRLKVFLSSYGTESVVQDDSLSLEEILSGFDFEESKRILKDQVLEYRSGFNRKSGLQGYMLLNNNSSVWYSEDLTQKSLSELEDTLKAIFNPNKEVKTMKTEVQINLGSNVSNNQVKNVLTELGIDTTTVNLQFLKTMNSKVDALEIILESITSIVHPINVEVDMLGMINDLCITVTKIGNYTGDHIAALLVESWADNAKDLYASPVMHGIIKAWIIEAVRVVKAIGFHKIKDLKIILFSLAIKHLQPLL